MSNDFIIHEHELHGQLWNLRVVGRLEADTAQKLRTHCADMRNQGCRELVLDLSGIDFIASSGVGALLALTEEFGGAGGSLYLAPVSEEVLSVVRLLNLDQFLAIYDSLDAATAIHS